MTHHRLASDWQSREPEISTAHGQLWWDDELVMSGDTDPSNGPTDDEIAGSPKTCPAKGLPARRAAAEGSWPPSDAQ
jgi:hypothetical protein